MEDTRTEFQKNLPGAQYIEDMEKYGDGDQIFLRQYCAYCLWNRTGQIGFVLNGKEYCVDCYPAIVNAYVASKKLKDSKRKEEVTIGCGE